MLKEIQVVWQFKIAFEDSCKLYIFIAPQFFLREYICDEVQCKKAFKLKQHLKNHINNVHSKNTISCSFPSCSKSFKLCS